MTAREIGTAVGGVLGIPEAEATRRIRHWVSLGVIPAGARNGDGVTSPFLYPAAAPAVAAVLMLLAEMGVARPEMLAEIWRYLAARPDDEANGNPRIDSVLLNVSTGEDCRLVLTLWRKPDGRPSIKVSLRLFGDMTEVTPPQAGDAFQNEIVIDLNALLARFAGANVVPFKAAN